MPKEFSGNREDLRKFILSCTAHFVINRKHYDTSDKKIGFMLALMNEGEAEMWKEQFIENAFEKGINNERPFGTFTQFLSDLRTSFKPFDEASNALAELRALKHSTMGKIDEHISKFKQLLHRTRLDKSASQDAVIEFFRESLTPQLHRRILNADEPPTTLLDWYKRAAQYDAQMKKIQKIFQKTNPSQTQTKTTAQTSSTPKKFTFSPRKDPNAMDVDSMTTEERTSLMKIGACFKCKKVGHLSRDCPDPNPKKEEKKKEEPKKWKGKEMAAYVRAQMMNMDEDEKEAFFESAADKGF